MLQTTVLVTHGIHHLPSADKVIIMDAGRITHFGSFEQVREAGATFASLASTAEVGVRNGNGQVLAKEDATAATVVDEEQDEELHWTNEQTSRRGAYAFYMKCTGVARACGLFALIAVWGGTSIFSMAYLSSASPWLLHRSSYHNPYNAV
jgi:ABC-type sulfate/molybdate transport systems ATPase subunit